MLKYLISSLLITFALLIPNTHFSQWNNNEIKKKVDIEFPGILDEFLYFLSLPNTSDDSLGIAKNIDYLTKYLDRLSFKTQTITFKNTPYFFASYNAGAPDTLLFYLQLDGQPVDAKLWYQKDPFKPVIKTRIQDSITSNRHDDNQKLENQYVYARAASDSKGPTFAFLSALKILLQNGKQPSVNIKIIGDPKEEKGSPNIQSFVQQNTELLTADGLVIMDGTRHISNIPTLTFGARGIATFQLTLYGATKDLHSGQYGNVVENPVFAMARLISGMKDEKGRVTLPEFYSGVTFNPQEENYFKTLPDRWDSLKVRIGGGKLENVGETIQQAFHYPSLNVRGIKAGWTGNQVRTIIPKEVTAEFDMRLAPNATAEKQLKIVKDYIKSQGYLLLNRPPTKEERLSHSKIIAIKERIGSKPFRTSLNNPLGNWLYNGSVRGLGSDNVLKVSTTGGSQPIAAFINALKIPAISLRIPNPDNNIHAPNENLNLLNFKEGVLQCLGILNETYR